MVFRNVTGSTETGSYKIANRNDDRNITIYCRDRAEENIRDLIAGESVWEDRIVIDELIKKGALIPS